MTHRIPIIALAFGLLSVFASEAAETEPTPYTLKNKSRFTASDAKQRTPFWPIGWTKRSESQLSPAGRLTVVPKVTLEPGNFKVTSILLGQPSLAIINGRTYSEGEFLRQQRAAGGSATVATSPIAPGARIRVFRINDGSVVLDYQEQQITVPLQRPELGDRKAEQELLLEDRP
ncbi:MAG TPA: hypothetical protein VF593_10855 [Chthoniobacteraceae bacterium]|jgi:hypothetical protein